MLKLRFSKPEVKVIRNVEEPITLAQIKCSIVNTALDDIPYEFIAKGKVTLHKDDVYDERYGKILAISMAKRNAYKIAARRYSFAANDTYREYTKRRVENSAFYLRMQAYRKLEEKDFNNMVKLGKVPDRPKKK